MRPTGLAALDRAVGVLFGGAFPVGSGGQGCVAW